MTGLDIKKIIEEELAEIGLDWDIKGILDSKNRVYVIPNDTKLISTVLELVTMPMILEIAKKYNFQVVQSDRQTVYPDITIIHDGKKYALDIKSTYRRSSNKAGFTLGSYTGYLRNPTKNIMFPYYEYESHWIMGFIYTRSPKAESDIVDLSEIDSIVPPIKDIEIIVQEKYKIASSQPGSGNTANIGSITDIEKLKEGTGPFAELGEEAFEDYWRNYLQLKIARDRNLTQPYKDIDSYLAWKSIQQ
jgi:hypothetical protein